MLHIYLNHILLSLERKGGEAWKPSRGNALSDIWKNMLEEFFDALFWFLKFAAPITVAERSKTRICSR
jgi:hypothetical protein